MKPTPQNQEQPNMQIEVLEATSSTPMDLVPTQPLILTTVPSTSEAHISNPKSWRRLTNKAGRLQRLEEIPPCVNSSSGKGSRGGETLTQLIPKTITAELNQQLLKPDWPPYHPGSSAQHYIESCLKNCRLVIQPNITEAMHRSASVISVYIKAETT
ncbi:subtilisin-chymotrypsin inhibitor CI-1B [Striga asiatica]|uniref:Subtilisin-chymotrypsin inhibitor CI-1B n=1 Tax=Striga asiatica TaxID=4170 RepID=A0A5A7PH76_STRAF|nr:subtilisin-chymotrypsin inhibitor CI-1B [Striga asiatica]